MTAALHKDCSRRFRLAGGTAVVGAFLLITWGAAARCKSRCTKPPHLSGLQSAQIVAHQHASADAMPPVPDGYRQVVPAGGGMPVMFPDAGRACCVPHSVLQAIYSIWCVARFAIWLQCGVWSCDRRLHAPACMNSPKVPSFHLGRLPMQKAIALTKQGGTPIRTRYGSSNFLSNSDLLLAARMAICYVSGNVSNAGNERHYVTFPHMPLQMIAATARWRLRPIANSHQMTASFFDFWTLQRAKGSVTKSRIYLPIDWWDLPELQFFLQRTHLSAADGSMSCSSLLFVHTQDPARVLRS